MKRLASSKLPEKECMIPPRGPTLLTLDDGIYLLKHRVYAPQRGGVQGLRQLNLTTKNLLLGHLLSCQFSGNPDRFL